MKAVLHSPGIVAWGCRICKWKLECDWSERMDVQVCPHCKAKQYVPGGAFSWNARWFRAKLEECRVAELRRQRAEAAERQLQEEARRNEESAAARRRAGEEAERRREEREAELARNRLSVVAVGAGLLDSAKDLGRMDPQSVARLKRLDERADELHDDLLSAFDSVARADTAVAYGRPAVAGASVIALLAGQGWVGLVFGAMAAGVGVIGADRKRARASQMQAKWRRIYAQFSAEDTDAFSRIFGFKYPGLATRAADTLNGRLDSM